MASNILAIGLTNEYKELVSNESRQSYISGTITKENGAIIEVTNDMIVPGSLYTTNQCTNGESFEVGTVFSAEMGVALRLDDDKNSFYNAKVDLSYFIYDDPSKIYQVRLGEFFVSEATRGRKSITLKAYDNMLLLDKEIDEGLEGTIDEAMAFISRKCGITTPYSSSNKISDLFANGGTTIYVDPSIIKTYRELLSQICKLTFTFAKVSWGGTLTLNEYTSAPVRKIEPKIKKTSSVSDFEVSFSRIEGSFLVAETEGEMYYKVYEKSDTTDSLSYSLGDISILKGDDESNQAVIDVLFEKLKGIRYIPCDVSFIGDPSLELGDMVTNVDMDGVETNFYITFYKWTYRGAHHIKGAGKDPKTSTVKEKADKVLEKVKAVVNLFNSRITHTEEGLEAVFSTVGGQTVDITALKATAQSLRSEVSSIQIGGTNLLLNSSFTENLDNWEAAVNAEIVELDGVKCARIVGELGKTKTVQQDVFEKLDVDNLDQEYVFSADVRVDNYVAGSTNPYVKLYFSGFDEENAWLGATQVKGAPDIPTQAAGKWKRIYWVVKFAKKPISMKAFMHARDFTGTLYFKNLKLEKGNRPTEWSPAPQDADAKYTSKTTFEQTARGFEASIADAKTTATSFLTYTTNTGVLLGYKNSQGNWVGNRAQILPGAFNILNSSGQLSSSFGDTLIELGKLSENALINMCAGKGLIRYGSDGQDFGLGVEGTLSIISDNVNLQGRNQAGLYQNYLEDGDTADEKRGYVSSVHADNWGIELSSAFSPSLENVDGEWVGFWDFSLISLGTGRIDMMSSDISLSCENELYINTTLGGVHLWTGQNFEIRSMSPDVSELQINIPLCFYHDDSRVGAIHVNPTSGYMEFGGPNGYYFGGNVRATYFYTGFDTSKDAGVLTLFEDGKFHYIAGRSAGGLATLVGWGGSSSYKTVTVLRGQSCRLSSTTGTVITSDERLKKDFIALDSWEGFFNDLKPLAFRMKDGASGRYHIGFKAGDVEEALAKNGLSTQDFAGFVKMKYEPEDDDDPKRVEAYKEAGINPGDDEFGLIYTEFTALNTYEIQKLKSDVKDIKAKLGIN